VSVTFRDFSNNATNLHQWIVLDGDIDAGGYGWCELCFDGFVPALDHQAPGNLSAFTPISAIT